MAFLWRTLNKIIDRQAISRFVNHAYFQYSIFMLIILNAIIIGFETYPDLYSTYGALFLRVDMIFLWIFTIEITLRLIGTPHPKYFFKDGWNVFDFIIVAAGHLFVGAYFVTVLRILRILRLFRTISVIPSLKRLVNALLLTLPSLGNISLLLSVIFYVFAVIGTSLFSGVAPDYFGTLDMSLITLFQVVTLESWASAVMRPILEELSWAWIYFVAFILLGTFVIFNLFVGVIVSNVEKVDAIEAKEHSNRAQLEPEAHSPSDKVATELAQLRLEIHELKEFIHKQGK